MKKTYETPGMYFEEFLANEYITACSQLEVSPSSPVQLVCNIGGSSHNGGCEKDTWIHVDGNKNVVIKEGSQTATNISYTGLSNIREGVHNYTLRDIRWTTKSWVGIANYNHTASSITISITASRNAS